MIVELAKRRFDKGGTKWSKIVYSIAGFDGYTVELKSKNGKTIYARSNEIKKVKSEQTDAETDAGIWEVEKIIDHVQNKNGTYKYLIRWKGHDPKFDSWEPQKNLPLINKNKPSRLEKNYRKIIGHNIEQ